MSELDALRHEAVTLKRTIRVVISKLSLEFALIIISRMHEKQCATPALRRQRLMWKQSVEFKCAPDAHFAVT